MAETTPQDQLERAKQALARRDLAEARALLLPLALAGKPPAARFFLARCAFLEQDLETAHHWLAIVRKKQPKHAGALILEGQMALARGDIDAAEAAAGQAAELNPDLPLAQTVLAEVRTARSRDAAARYIATLDAGYAAARTDGAPPEELAAAARGLAGIEPGPDWPDDPVQARIAFFHFAPDPVAALRNYDPALIDVSCELGYVTWPRRIHDLVRGRKVLDVGCGFGGYGMGFLIAGATSYAGLDPEMKLDSTRAKNKRTRTWSDMGVTPREIMENLPAIRLFEGTAESITFDETFDTISLHNVTEHLIALETVLAGLVPLFGPDTRMVYLHHNFHCWNGHHFAPNQPHQWDPDNRAHNEVADWRHIEIAEDLPEDHYFRTHLNRVTLAEIRDITERHFEIETWEELPSSQATLDRLTPEVRHRVAAVRPDLTDRDLTTNVVFCVARRKGS